ncbi:MAG TPA: hypothetical protein VGG61_04645 [Gemmataceae bacterium]
MYKLFGVGVAAFAAGILSVIAAGGYADQYPESALARCLNAAHCASDADTAHTCCKAASVTPADPMPCHETYDPLPPLIKVEQEPSTCVHNRLPGTIVINEQEAVPQTGAISASEPEPCEVPEQVRKIMLSLRRDQDTPDLGVEDCQPVAPFMPYCEDEEPAPAVMPYAEDSASEQAAGSIFSFWMGFYANADAKGTKNAAPECKEDPAAPLQYPGLPFSGFAPQIKNAPIKAKSKTPVTPFEEELQEASPAPKPAPDFKNLLKKDGTLADPKLRSHIDTTECRPSDFGFDNLGLRPF